MTVEHADPDCTGFWTLRKMPGYSEDGLVLIPVVVCSRCGEMYGATPEVRDEAQAENRIAIAASRAAQAGRRALERERKEPGT